MISANQSTPTRLTSYCLVKMKRNENVEILTFFAAADIYPSYQRVRPCQVQSIMFPNNFWDHMVSPVRETPNIITKY